MGIFYFYDLCCLVCHQQLLLSQISVVSAIVEHFLVPGIFTKNPKFYFMKPPPPETKQARTHSRTYCLIDDTFNAANHSKTLLLVVINDYVAL